MTEKISGEQASFSVRYVGNLELGDHMERVRRNLIAETETLDGRFRYGFQMDLCDPVIIVYITRYLSDDAQSSMFPPFSACVRCTDIWRSRKSSSMSAPSRAAGRFKG